jgi:hemerythrin-like domain-containing protein
MTSNFPGMPNVDAGFEAPLEMLAACHDRIRSRCSTLLRLRSHVAECGTDVEARTAAQGVIRYFDTSALDHHEDEEQDLFPALLEAMAGSDPVCIRELTESLADDHRELARLWTSVRVWLVAIERGETPLPDAGNIESFVDLYERHAGREEQELFPMATRLLGDEELDRIGRSMRLRRGITSV